MAYRIELKMSLNCDDSDEAELELDEMAEYISGRLSDGSDYERVIQAMVEAIVELHSADDGDTVH
tara:strand:+ start:310 stop:504 length:195 start_codon:yes stop_codon:yes gene_type:complete